jgi:hypothetical protein
MPVYPGAPKIVYLMKASAALDFDAKRLVANMVKYSSDVHGLAWTDGELGIRLRTAEIGFSESTSARRR